MCMRVYRLYEVDKTGSPESDVIGEIIKLTYFKKWHTNIEWETNPMYCIHKRVAIIDNLQMIQLKQNYKYLNYMILINCEISGACQNKKKKNVVSRASKSFRERDFINRLWIEKKKI